MKSLFHFAFNVTDLEKSREFYGGLLGCREGRSTDTWVDFDFFNHQISLHLGKPFETDNTGRVGDKVVPMPHFGVILDMDSWNVLAKKLQAEKVKFIIEPMTRFAGQPGEQATMFFYDPFLNPIEIKGFTNIDGVYQS